MLNGGTLNIFTPITIDTITGKKGEIKCNPHDKLIVSTVFLDNGRTLNINNCELRVSDKIDIKTYGQINLEKSTAVLERGSMGLLGGASSILCSEGSSVSNYGRISAESVKEYSQTNLIDCYLLNKGK